MKLEQGKYNAIPYEDLELPDNPNVYWKDGLSYNAIVDNRGCMSLTSEGIGETKYTEKAVESMKTRNTINAFFTVIFLC